MLNTMSDYFYYTLFFSLPTILLFVVTLVVSSIVTYKSKPEMIEKDIAVQHFRETCKWYVLLLLAGVSLLFLFYIFDFYFKFFIINCFWLFSTAVVLVMSGIRSGNMKLLRLSMLIMPIGLAVTTILYSAVLVYIVTFCYLA